MINKILKMALVWLISNVFLSFLWPFDRKPYRFLPPKGEVFFRCGKCASLEGGIYGRGPFERLRTTKAGWCRHAWKTVTALEFMRFAQETFSFQLEARNPWWASRAGGR